MIYITFDDHNSLELCNSQSFQDITDWVKKLSVRKFPKLTHLIYHGYSDRLNLLAREIDQALNLFKPRYDLIPIVKILRDNAREHEITAHIVMINNGIQPAH